MAWFDIRDYQCEFSIKANTGRIDIRIAAGVFPFKDLTPEKYSAILLTLTHPSVQLNPQTGEIRTMIEQP